MTIAQERARILEQRAVGVNCRCCTQRVKIYYRTLNAKRGQELLRLLRAMAHSEIEGRWVHKDEFVEEGGGDYGKLKTVPWCLIESRPAAKGIVTNGLWRLTRQWGIPFAKGRIKMPRQIPMCLNEPLLPLAKGHQEVWMHEVLEDEQYHDARRYVEYLKVMLAGTPALRW